MYHIHGPTLVLGSVLMSARLVSLVSLFACSMAGCSSKGTVAAEFARAHGVALPRSASNVQMFVDSSCGLSLFQVSCLDAERFVGGLNRIATNAPLRTSGTPLVNGWNVWPTTMPTFVPGNIETDFRRTWPEPVHPRVAYSCHSTVGDWLHVELWRGTNGPSVVKVYTDHN